MMSGICCKILQQQQQTIKTKQNSGLDGRNKIAEKLLKLTVHGDLSVVYM